LPSGSSVLSAPLSGHRTRIASSLLGRLMYLNRTGTAVPARGGQVHGRSPTCGADNPERHQIQNLGSSARYWNQTGPAGVDINKTSRPELLIITENRGVCLALRPIFRMTLGLLYLALQTELSHLRIVNGDDCHFTAALPLLCHLELILGSRAIAWCLRGKCLEVRGHAHHVRGHARRIVRCHPYAARWSVHKSDSGTVFEVMGAN
jgi:hypothetical protein